MSDHKTPQETPEQRVLTLTSALQALDGEITRLRSALEIIAGRKQCIDNLLSHAEIAILALDTAKSFRPAK